jgi:adenine-specific DNA-methyltransferase
LLRADLPDLDFWVGKPIASGRPSRKEHWVAKPEAERIAPFSSWIAGLKEDVQDEDLEAPFTMRSTRGGVATDEVKEILGSKAFSFPKPLSLIKGLLSQATHKDDIVLDFFAGSGTTGQAVLELNAEDGPSGKRRYILCSSTEVTEKEPTKNICRDITARRLRRVSQGFAGKPGYSLEQGGEFAYLQLDKVSTADLPFEAGFENAWALLCLRLAHGIWSSSDAPVQRIARSGDCDILFCREVNEAAVEALAMWPKAHGAGRLAVYCERPIALQEMLEARGVEANCHSLHDALLNGQARGQA